MSIFESRQIMFHLFASVIDGRKEVKLHLSSRRLNEINIVIFLIKGRLKLGFTLTLPTFPKKKKKKCHYCFEFPVIQLQRELCYQ